MPNLPISTSFTGSSITEADFKNAITQLRDFLSGLLGDDGTAATARSALGVITSVSGTAPVVVAGGTTAPVVSMPEATISASGYMTATQAAQLVNVISIKDVQAGGVGMMAFMKTTVSLASNNGVVGTSLRYVKFNSSGSFTDTGVAAAGTWRNIGTDLLAGETGMFQCVS